ncbi:carboxypeptidase-like regulatory domain-containing protein [Hufsiella ginkgonis]|uniref:Carboxypeptidase-like regulatory domain-containing protein n=1 Tax=Hufsiella ginkgonis TaxID=2695274 RepID=A0A7K1XVI5_9SPHI|nr:carboxypeptidase-like regulatory domain-containing protein [Hufsiella ginkgonis]MXV14818.1 hypothetical protein [Hufsiella ginkgonis]
MKFKSIILTTVCLFIIYTAYAQQSITGVLLDESKQPVAGATITVKGHNKSTSTNTQGKFKIDAKLNETLVVSYNGFAPLQFRITSSDLTLRLNASPALTELTEAQYLKTTKDNLQILNTKQAYSKNAKTRFSSDPTLPVNGTAGLGSNNQLQVTATDSDGDGLTNQDEQNIGTDKNNPDTDGDALYDGWEVGVVNGMDLKSFGASPLHKDIFVQMDYMTRATAKNGLGPNTNVVKGIEKSFSNAPVNNPDGINGINIHLVLGNEIPHKGDLSPLADAFADIKRQYFDPNKGSVFHYMVWADGYEGGASSGNAMSIGGSDFVVTLGLWNNGDGGTDDQKTGTFIHELGHNLGLRHGDTDDLNYKPNHISVMNYAYQISGVLLNDEHRYIYQPFSLPPLDERNLNETEGLKAPSLLKGYFIQYLSPARVLVPPIAAGGKIDWNYNQVIDQSIIQADINSDFQRGVLPATRNQWTSVQYKCGSIGRHQQIAGLIDETTKRYNKTTMEELTEQMVLDLH